MPPDLTTYLESFKRWDIFPACAAITQKASELILLEFLLGRWEATFVAYRCCKNYLP